MIEPMATGTVKRPPTDLRRTRGRQVLATHPPAPVDDTTSGRLEQRAENTSAPVTLLPPETADPRKTAAWTWSKVETEHRRHAAATQPLLPRSTPSLTCTPTVDHLTAIRPDADPDATGPHSALARIGTSYFERHNGTICE